MTNAILRGKPDAGNPHVRFDEGEVASAKPRRGSLLYKQLTVVLAAVVLCGQSAVAAERIFREARHSRGNTNVLKVQPIDSASWLWTGESVPADGAFLKFRRRFHAKKDAPKLIFDISADERFYLTLDGAFVARGPNRATVENWQYQTYEVALAEGEHVLEATVWRTGERAPLAQLSGGGGFILKAEGAYDAELTTGVAPWEVGRIEGLRPLGKGACWGTGDQWEFVGTGLYDAAPARWQTAVVVRGPAGGAGYGLRTEGWMLFPTQLPDQTETWVRPGKIVASTAKAPWRGKYVYTAADAKDEAIGAMTIPAHRRVQLAWNLGRYYCAYPVLKMKGAKGSRVSWTWAEATQRAADGLKGSETGARDTIVGRYLNGYGDIFVNDGRSNAVFSTPWFRCGKWCRLDIETGDAPLEITDLALIENRYPLEDEGAFASPDDPSLADIRRISLRSMQMCSHETLYDCPYYEQQMYPGDTRVQLNVLAALTRDDRLVKRAIELYDLGTRDDGQCPFNWPTRGLQEGATYTLCYLCMFGDYAMNRADRDWLKARLPGLRKSMAGMETYENAEGLLENLPGWPFMDWTVGWRSDGVAPGGRAGEGVNAEANLFWALAMKSAALAERALGHELQARYWEEKREALKAKIVERFWCESRGLLADTPAMCDFSEHAQCLAIVGDVLPADKAQRAFEHLIADADLKRVTVYFSYYLFESYFKFGRGDLFLKRLDLWRDYVKKGLTTTQEAPDGGKNGQVESRSDCHAWGAHPIWWMQTGLAGIRSAAPWFKEVLVAPCPGGLTSLKARHPHPRGFVEVDLAFADGRVTGTVSTPVEGTFVFGGRVRKLSVGQNQLKDF